VRVESSINTIRIIVDMKEDVVAIRMLGPFVDMYVFSRKMVIRFQVSSHGASILLINIHTYIYIHIHTHISSR
jgi:hypothetical protein